MNKFVFFIFIILSGSLFAQNNFIYVRYNLSDGNASLVVEEIDKIVKKTTEQYVIYYSNGQKPTICINHEEWLRLRTSILTQQTPPDYYAEEDLSNLNAKFFQYFSESVDTATMTISGKNDLKWTCTFILSERMIQDESDADLVLRIIAINQLDDRMKISLIGYSEDDITYKSIEDLKNNKFIKYSNNYE